MKDAAKVGFISSLLVILTVVSFGVCLILALFGINTDTASYGICLLLAFCFLAMIAAIHEFTAPEKRVWSRIGLSFATIYAVMIGICYYTQLAVVRTNSLRLSAEVLKAFDFVPGSVTFALDMGLGYTFLTLAPLFLIPVFGRTHLEKWLKTLILINWAFFCVPTFIYPLLDLAPSGSSASMAANFGAIGLLFWCAVFVPIPILLAVFFRRQAVSLQNPS